MSTTSSNEYGYLCYVPAEIDSRDEGEYVRNLIDARGDRRRFKIYHTNVGEWKAALCVDPGRIWVRPTGAYYKSTSRLEPQRYVPFTSLERLTERELRR